MLVLGIGCLYVRYTRGAIENFNPVILNCITTARDGTTRRREDSSAKTPSA